MSVTLNVEWKMYMEEENELKEGVVEDFRKKLSKSERWRRTFTHMKKSQKGVVVKAFGEQVSKSMEWRPSFTNLIFRRVGPKDGAYLEAFF